MLSLILPLANAQNPDAETEEPPQEKPAKNAAQKKEAPKTTQFTDQQKKIQTLMDKIKKTKKFSEKRRLADGLKREQNVLRLLYNKHITPLKEKQKKLQEQIRLSRKEYSESLKKELAATEEEIKNMETAAALDKWCINVRELVGKENKSASDPGPGSGKKGKKNKRKRK